MEKRFNLKKLAAVATVSVALLGCSAPLVSQAMRPSVSVNAAVNNRNPKQKQDPNKHYDINNANVAKHRKQLEKQNSMDNSSNGVVSVRRKNGVITLPKPIEVMDILSFNDSQIKIPKGTVVHYHSNGFDDMVVSTNKLHNNSQHRYITSGIYLNSLINMPNSDKGEGTDWGAHTPKGYVGQKPKPNNKQKSNDMMKHVGKTYGHSSLPRTADSHINPYVGGGIIVVALAGIFALVYFGRTTAKNKRAKK